jgi:hypothetical protein
MVVPVRIEGLEATISSRLTRAQVRRPWFRKVAVTVLDPVPLSVDEALKGKARRQAAGAMLYQIMSDLIFRTTPTDRTIVEAVAETAPALALNTPSSTASAPSGACCRRAVRGTETDCTRAERHNHRFTGNSPSPPFRGEREGPRRGSAGEGEVGIAANCLMRDRVDI